MGPSIGLVAPSDPVRTSVLRTADRFLMDRGSRGVTESLSEAWVPCDDANRGGACSRYVESVQNRLLIVAPYGCDRRESET